MDPTFSFAWFDYVCGSRRACFSAPYSPCARPGEAGNLSALLYFFRLAVLEHGVASEDHVRIQQEKGSAQCVRTEDVPPVRRFFSVSKKKQFFRRAVPGGLQVPRAREGWVGIFCASLVSFRCFYCRCSLDMYPPIPAAGRAKQETG